MSRFRASFAAAAWAALICSPVPAQELIAVDPLGQIAPFSVGALRDDELPLSPDLWRDADAEVIGELIGHTVAESRSLAASRLAARALLSQGRPSAGGQIRRELAVARVATAYRLGRLNAADLIVTSSLGAQSDPELARYGASARFALGRIAEACTLANEQTGEREQAFWVRARAACFALDGQHDAAALTFQLARERGAEGADEIFEEWLGVLADGEGGPATAPRDAIELAFSGAAGVPFPLDAIETSPLDVVAGVALDQRRRGPGRIMAAQRAARAGAISPDAYAAALAAMPAPADREPSQVLEAAFAAEGVQQVALLHHVARSDGEALLRAEAIAAALEVGDALSDYIIASEIYVADIASLPRTLETAEQGPAFAEAAAAAGDPEVARLWLGTRTAERRGPATLTAVEPEEASDPALDAIETGALYALITASDPDVDGGALLAAARGRLESVVGSGEPDIASAERDALLLLALGATNTPDLRRASERALAAEPAPHLEALAALYAMEAAADADSLGEAVLQASRALAIAGPESALVSARVARVLWRLGLDEDARTVVVQSILAGRRGE